MGGAVEVLEEYKRSPTRDLAEEVMFYAAAIRAETGSEIGFLLRAISRAELFVTITPDEFTEIRKKALSLEEYLSKKFKVPWITREHLEVVPRFEEVQKRYGDILNGSDWVVDQVVLGAVRKGLDPLKVLEEAGVEGAPALVRAVEKRWPALYMDFQTGARKTRELLSLASNLREVSFIGEELTFEEGIKKYEKTLAGLKRSLSEFGNPPTELLSLVDRRGASDLKWLLEHGDAVIREMKKDLEKHRELLKVTTVGLKEVQEKVITIDDVTKNEAIIERELTKKRELEQIVREDLKILRKWFYLTYKDREKVLEKIRTLTTYEQALKKLGILANDVKKYGVVKLSR